MNKGKNFLLNILYPTLAFLIILSVWFIIAAAIDKKLILPSPTEAIRELGYYLSSKQFYYNFLMTLLRSFLSFLISFVLAAILSVLSAISDILRRMIRPVIAVIRSVPTMAVILLVIIWTNSNFAPVVVALLVILPTLYSGFYSGIMGVDEKLIEMSNLYNVPIWSQITKMYLPCALPTVIETSASALSLTIKLVIAAEVLSQTRDSIGVMMQQSQMYFETGKLIALTLCAVIVSVAIESGVMQFKRLLRGN